MSARLTTNADILTLADAGELFRVEDGQAFLLSRADMAGLTEDESYGRDWIVVGAEAAAAAVAVGREYDAQGESAWLRSVDGIVAVQVEAQS